MANNKKPETSQKRRVSAGVAVRFAIIGALWLGVCAWFVVRVAASGQQVTLLTLFPLIASAVVVFVPLYKKYVRNDSDRK